MTENEAPEVAPISDVDLRYPLVIADLLRRQIRDRALHEPDFAFLGNFDPASLLVVDVGSSIGNSAVSCEVAAPGCRIIGFEPNLALRPLWDVAAAFCARYVCRGYGLSNEPGTHTVYVPEVDGEQVVGETATSIEHFFDPIVSSRLRSYSRTNRFRLLKTAMRFERLDDQLDVRNTARDASTVVLKLDVEGAELSALRGGEAFLRERKPILLIEHGDRDDIVQWCSGLGYVRCLHDTVANKLWRATDHRALNSFFVTAGSLPDHLLAT